MTKDEIAKRIVEQAEAALAFRFDCLVKAIDSHDDARIHEACEDWLDAEKEFLAYSSFYDIAFENALKL